MTEPKCFGCVKISHPKPLIAGQLVTVVFDFTVGDGGMREDGRLRILCALALTWAPGSPRKAPESETTNSPLSSLTQADQGSHIGVSPRLARGSRLLRTPRSQSP